MSTLAHEREAEMNAAAEDEALADAVIALLQATRRERRDGLRAPGATDDGVGDEEVA